MAHPSIQQLINLVESGVKPTVRILRDIYEGEFELNPGCKAIVKSYSWDKDCHLFTLDASPYRGLNESFYKANYWDDKGNATLKVYEYHKDWEEMSKSLPLWLGDDQGDLLEICNLNPVQKEYLESGYKQPYVEWLEQELLGSKAYESLSKEY